MKAKVLKKLLLAMTMLAGNANAKQYDVFLFNQIYEREAYLGDLKETFQMQHPDVNLADYKLVDVILFAKSAAGRGTANFQLGEIVHPDLNVPRGNLNSDDLNTFHFIRLARPNINVDMNQEWGINLSGKIKVAKAVFDIEPKVVPAGPIVDVGHNMYPKTYADVNGDGYQDYCRFVGDAPYIFLSCQLGVQGGFSLNPYGFNSVKGIDIGYHKEFAVLADVNGDRRLDYCRLVGDGNQKFISCNLAEQNGFSPNQHGYSSIRGIDMGYKDRGRVMQDVNNDGRADFCRYVGDVPNIRYSCNFAEQFGFSTNQYNTMN